MQIKFFSEEKSHVQGNFLKTIHQNICYIDELKKFFSTILIFLSLNVSVLGHAMKNYG